MKKILVVCAAGASSTFLVHHMRQAADRADTPFHIEAGTATRPDFADGFDVVLVGDPLRDRFADLRHRAEVVGAVVVQLPPLAYDPAGARVALALADGIPTTEAAEPPTDPHSMRSS